MEINKVQNTCKNCHSNIRSKHYRDNRDFYKNKHLKRTYGITVEQYRELQEKQLNLCACCGKPETRISSFTKKTSDLAVDHCHDSGNVRGLLCFKCNAAIGLVLNNPDILNKMSKYLTEFKK